MPIKIFLILSISLIWKLKSEKKTKRCNRNKTKYVLFSFSVLTGRMSLLTESKISKLDLLPFHYSNIIKLLKLTINAIKRLYHSFLFVSLIFCPLWHIVLTFSSKPIFFLNSNIDLVVSLWHDIYLVESNTLSLVPLRPPHKKKRIKIRTSRTSNTPYITYVY